MCEHQVILHTSRLSHEYSATNVHKIQVDAFRLHFYNTPITKNFTEASHPLNIIRSIYQPGDFIVVKLDIDNGPLELAIMKEIESNPVLLSSITEMMFEQHYDHEGEMSLHHDSYTDMTFLFRSACLNHTLHLTHYFMQVWDVACISQSLHRYHVNYQPTFPTLSSAPLQTCKHFLVLQTAHLFVILLTTLSSSERLDYCCTTGHEHIKR